LLVISPATSQHAANALSSDLGEFLVTHTVRDSSAIDIATATATSDRPIGATALIDRLESPPVSTPA
jgi:hypothetical protein